MSVQTEPVSDIVGASHTFDERETIALLRAFGSMPYGGLCHFRRPPSMGTPVFTLDDVLHNLGALRDVLERVASDHGDRDQELRHLQSQRRSVGQFLHEALKDASS